MKSLSSQKTLLYRNYVALSSGGVIGVQLEKFETSEGFNLYVEQPIIRGFGIGAIFDDTYTPTGLDEMKKEVRRQLAQISRMCETLAAELLNHAVEFSRLADGKIDLVGCGSVSKPKRDVATVSPVDSDDDLLADLLDELE